MTALPLTLDWRNGQPYSRIFEDVYFSSDDGWAETQYVFINGNQLPPRWQSLTNPSFNITETGFGTGLNFWCAVLAWLQHAPQPATLHFTSIEKYPLSLADMQQAFTLWPDLTPFAPQFLAHYATLQAGPQSLAVVRWARGTHLMGGRCAGGITITASGCATLGFWMALPQPKTPACGKPAVYAHMGVCRTPAPPLPRLPAQAWSGAV
jgi:hypothetical protein